MSTKVVIKDVIGSYVYLREARENQNGEKDYSSITQYFQNGYNIGFVLSDTDLVVDCDPRNYKDGTDSLELLQNDLGCRLQDHAPTVKTGGGGFHFYFSKPSPYV